MIHYLSKLKLPVDDLLQKLYQEEHLESIVSRYTCVKKNKALGPDLVRDPTLQRVARHYITQLLNNREKYGYLYFLYAQSLRLPLNVEYKADSFVEHPEQVEQALGELAQEFAALDTIFYNVTMVELLYFFIRVIHPSLSWIALDYQLQCARSHAHLIISPHRPYSWKKVE